MFDDIFPIDASLGVYIPPDVEIEAISLEMCRYEGEVILREIRR